MGVLVAHTVVLVLDAAWVDSGFCASELATFRKNCKLARDFWCVPHFGVYNAATRPAAALCA